jgi:sugar-specific transcriptional regulator TrmB
MENLIKEMQKIGFTSYEAKIYIALLKHNPATGYEISKTSGVPQAKVYENILRLNNLGVVLSLGSDPVKYVPLPAEELLRKANMDFEESISKLKESLPSFQHEEKLDYVWNIKGYYSTMEKAVSMLHDAKKSILLSIWDEDALFIYNELAEAVNSGVRADILLYGRNTIHGIDNIYFHGGEEKLLEKYGGKWICLVVDEREVLVGQINDEKDGISIWTENQSIIFISSSYINYELSISGKYDKGERLI